MSRKETINLDIRILNDLSDNDYKTEEKKEEFRDHWC